MAWPHPAVPGQFFFLSFLLPVHRATFSAACSEKHRPRLNSVCGFGEHISVSATKPFRFSISSTHLFHMVLHYCSTIGGEYTVPYVIHILVVDPKSRSQLAILKKDSNPKPLICSIVDLQEPEISRGLYTNVYYPYTSAL